jgi:chromosome segregation ATPase
MSDDVERELNDKVEGLGQQNTELEDELNRHRLRYSFAMKMIGEKTAQAEEWRRRYTALTEANKNLVNAFYKLQVIIEKATEAIRMLPHVPSEHLEDAATTLADTIDYDSQHLA